LPTAISRLKQVRSAADLLALVPTAHQIRAFEDNLEDTSLVSRTMTPWVGWVVKALLHGGDEQVYFGRAGWLFYRTSVDSVTGPGFLTQQWQHRRLRDADQSLPPPQPDPVKALLQFQRQLAERGIVLVVMPVPGKESIYPEILASLQADDEVIQNPSFGAFKSQLSAAGVLVFDPAPILADLKHETPAYLMTDTHWSPAAVQRVAAGLAAWLTEKNLLPPTASASSRYLPATVHNSGDITVMLALPQNQSFFPPETAALTRVVAADGSPWQPDEQADVLVMGDSFNNIYSLGEMGWGDSAGFAEHLSAALGRPLDRLVINAGGAHTTRQELVREMAAGRDRLAGKRVVIYEFAARELAFGDWRLFDLPPRAPQVVQVAAPAGELVIQGRIAALGRLPKPGSVPYKDCILSIRLADVRGLPSGDGHQELLVYAMGMKDNKWLPVSSLMLGREVQCRLRAWAEVEGKYGTYNRAELDDMDLLLLPTFWAEEVTQ
jgi:alginate O-acetyltransferase complex protein AlgJ